MNRNLVIVAGGLGTRFKELSIFPKLLLPTNTNSSILHEDIMRFESDYNIYLLINSKFYDMVKNYIEINKISDKLSLIRVINYNGSYNTIKSVYDQIPHENIMFYWSDIILDADLPLFDKNTIVTYQSNYRYEFNNGKINKSNSNGNIPGIYYFNGNIDKYFKTEVDSINNCDLVDIISKYSNDFNEYQISSLTEYRDLDTYINIIKNSNTNIKLKTRFFNKITIKNDNILVKQAIDTKYYQLIQDEYNWYKKLNNEVICPKVYDFKDNGFEMEYLKDYIPLHSYIKTHELNDIIAVYTNIKKNLDILHSTKLPIDLNRFKDDLKKEVIDKIITRCDNIKYMLVTYDKEYMIKLLTKAYNILLSTYTEDNTYSFCHGDLNGSNIMVNPNTKEVKFIDPRGYFGYTKLFGWKPYEYAKLLYCLNGYDDFNNLPQIYRFDEPKKLDCYDKIDYLNKDEYKILVGVIYVALAGYISQDIMKANIAYEYGIKILKDYVG